MRVTEDPAHPWQGKEAGAQGKSIVTADSLTSVAVAKRGSGLDASVVVRGIGPQGLALYREARLTNGRLFRPACRNRRRKC